MNRVEFARALVDRMIGIGTDNGGMKLRTDQALAITDAIFDPEFGVIARELHQHGGEVAFSGFGRLYTHVLAPRNARNPQTGETFVTEAGRTVRFKLGSILRHKVASVAPRVGDIPTRAAPAAADASDTDDDSDEDSDDGIGSGDAEPMEAGA